MTTTGQLMEEFETEYRSVQLTAMNTNDTNDGTTPTTIAAEKWTISNKPSTHSWTKTLPDILEEAGEEDTDNKTLSRTRSGMSMEMEMMH